MIKNEKARVWVNRIFAFAAGGMLLFLIMNFSVAEKLRKELDESRYAAGQLLNDAKARIESKSYDRARESLNVLIEKHPGSVEAVEGNKLYELIESAVRTEQEMQAKMDSEWEEAVEGIRKEWEIKTATEMRDKIDKERNQLEKDMNTILSQEWEKNKARIREEWEKANGEA